MSRLIEVTSDIYTNPQVKRDSNIDDHVNDLNCDERVIKYLKKLHIRRGDVAHFEHFGNYRNDGKLMWSGTELVILDSNFDDYGAIPADFKLEEFNNDKNYFKDSIDHNSLVWITGSNYEIIGREVLTKIGDHKIYLYTIENIDSPGKWFIVSSLNSTRFKENALEYGLFQAESDIDEHIEVPESDYVLYGTDLLELDI